MFNFKQKYEKNKIDGTAVNIEDRDKRVVLKTEGLLGSLCEKQSLPHLYQSGNDFSPSAFLLRPHNETRESFSEEVKQKSFFPESSTSKYKEFQKYIKKKVEVLWAELCPLRIYMWKSKREASEETQLISALILSF